MKAAKLLAVRMPIAFVGAILGVEVGVFGLILAAVLPDSTPVIMLGMGSGALILVSLFQLARLFKELKLSTAPFNPGEPPLADDEPDESGMTKAEMEEFFARKAVAEERFKRLVEPTLTEEQKKVMQQPIRSPPKEEEK